MVFPVLNMYRVATMDPSEKTMSAAKGAWWQDLPARYLRTSTYLGLAMFSYAFTFPLERARSFEAGWVTLVLVRNLVLGYILYGGWHHFLYKSRFTDKMASRKFNPKVPSERQWAHDRFWSTVGMCIQVSIPACLQLLHAPHVVYAILFCLRGAMPT